MIRLAPIFLLILSSCGLFGKYDYGQHRYFKKALTKAEKDELNRHGVINKHWIGSNNLGDSLIGDILVKRNTPPEFIEIGDWYEKSILTRNGQRIGNYIRELKYDQNGNLRSITSYFLELGTNDFFLIEKMESLVNVRGLIQIYKGFYDTGELQYQFTLRVVDSATVKSDHLKKKDVEEYIQFFDKSGNQIERLSTHPFYGISKFTKMK